MSVNVFPQENCELREQTTFTLSTLSLDHSFIKLSGFVHACNLTCLRFHIYFLNVLKDFSFPLLEACGRQVFEVAQFLLAEHEKQCKLDAVGSPLYWIDNKHQTCLMRALARKPTLPTVSLLLSAGSPVDYYRRGLKTPCSSLEVLDKVGGDYEDVITLLLAYDANPSLTSSPLQFEALYKKAFMRGWTLQTHSQVCKTRCATKIIKTLLLSATKAPAVPWLPPELWPILLSFLRLPDFPRKKILTLELPSKEIENAS
eukprot:m.87374 g.87374  ORF g.87374 m.87374 type:complete len:258 (+) comp21397_c0_seq2:313-1086(+)